MSQPATLNTTFPSSSTGISDAPSDAWFAYPAPGATNGQAEFDLTDSENGYGNSFITWTFPQPANGLEYWAYQPSDGGLFSICFDCPPTSTLGTRIDALNASTNGTEPPRLLYANYNLIYAVHNLTIANLFDSRATILNSTGGGYGQMTLDHFVLVAPLNPPATSTSSPSPSTGATTAGASGSGSSSSSNVGTIVGGVVGGIGGLLVAVLGVLIFCLWRKRRRTSIPVNARSGRSETYLEPFMIDAPTGASPVISQLPHTSANATTSGPSFGTISISPAQAGTYVHGQSNTSQGTPEAGATPSAPTRTRRRRTTGPRREEDAGHLQGDDDLDEAAGTLPPDYHASVVGPRPEKP